jgi:hypothetical protein
MIRGTIIFILFFSSFFALPRANAANNVEHALNTDSFSAIDNLKVFIEGGHLDFNYIRSNIKFVDFVNDPLKADVHIIVTHKGTGGGGTNYVVNFYSKTVKQVGDFSLNCLTLPGDTDDTRREHITRTLKLGLMPFVNETTNSPMVEILYNSDMQQPAEKNGQDDPWNKWVFRAENIHNQLYLPAEEVSMEDILLGNQKLPSTFDLSGSVGLRIQFGSLYNNIINNSL